MKEIIQLDVKQGPSGQLQLYDMATEEFLPTKAPREAFVEFVEWIEVMN